ncbi:hypothetical protein BY996DRAFT_6601319 [Phakopsora pachyrhizi]|nr:hypothetical protein BY996DRAFT_6601319 [Phakopsora pachyrhizi]
MGGLGGGSAEFVNGELDCARRLPRVKTRVARVITLGLPHVGPLPREVEEGVVEKVGDRRALKYGDGVMNRDGEGAKRESVEDEAWGIRDRLGGGRMRIDGSADSGPMANATAAVVEDDCGSAVASVSAAAAATVVVVAVDDGVGVSVDVISGRQTDRVRFVKGGDHPRGWIWDGVGVSVFAQSRVSDRLIEGDNVSLTGLKHVEQTIPLFSSSEKIGPFLEWFKVDMEWVRGVGWVWVYVWIWVGKVEEVFRVMMA